MGEMGDENAGGGAGKEHGEGSNDVEVTAGQVMRIYIQWESDV